MCANHPTTANPVAANIHRAQLQHARINLTNVAAKGGPDEEAGLHFDERELRPLPRYVLAALDLTAAEKETGEVIALTRSHHAAQTPAEQCVSRLAVCRPVPRDEWGQLAPGTVVIYTEAYKFSVEERPFTAHIPVLVSHAGTVQFSRQGRGLFCTSTWCGNHDEEHSHKFSEVYELWEVTHFVSIPYAK